MHAVQPDSHKRKERTMTDRIDISKHTRPICEALGIKPDLVSRLQIRPTSAVVDVFLTDAQGAKYVTEDGKVAMETRTFEVTA
jgi:hypothetical protein